MKRDKQVVLPWLLTASGPTTSVPDRRCTRGASRRIGRRAERGFTLIEVMITCAVLAILSAIAYPSYANFVLRGKLVEPTNNLSAVRAAMEQFYQDNRTYANVGTILSPCDATRLPQLKNFTLSCTVTSSPDSYTITAVGSQPVTAGFSYSITNANIQSSTVGAVWGGTTCATAWITKNGDACY